MIINNKPLSSVGVLLSYYKLFKGVSVKLA